MRFDRPGRASEASAKAFFLSGILFLVGYSVALLTLEASTTQETVRPFFSDIGEDEPFFAVNTTLSVSLLGGAALLMLFAALCASDDRCPRQRDFLLSQAALFGFLAADDRFQLHERIGWRLGISDHYVLFVWGVFAVIAVLVLRPPSPPLRLVVLYAAGVGFFAMMFAIDAFAPPAVALRLSVEDLCKTWGAAMFFAFGWNAASYHLRGAAQSERPLASSKFAYAYPGRRNEEFQPTMGLAVASRPCASASPSRSSATPRSIRPPSQTA